MVQFLKFKGRFPLRRIQPRDQAMGVSGHAQLEIQAESERFLANARSVLEVESRSTFLRPEWAKANQISSFQC